MKNIFAALCVLLILLPALGCTSKKGRLKATGLDTEAAGDGTGSGLPLKDRGALFGIKNISTLAEITREGVTVKYSDGYSQTAEENLSRLLSMADYFKKELNIDFDFTLYLLDREDWPSAGAPYGMPACRPDANAVLVPVSGGGCIVDACLPQLESAPDIVFELFKKAGVSPEEGVDFFPLLIGYHEIGHLIEKEMGITNISRWFNEFFASYLALVYMSEFQAELADIWKANAYISPYSGEEFPPIVDLKALNLGKVEPHSPESIKNYDWFQKEFMKLCLEINEEAGIEFVHKVKISIGSRALGTEGELAVIREVSSSFDEWIVEVRQPGK